MLKKPNGIIHLFVSLAFDYFFLFSPWIILILLKHSDNEEI